MTRDVITADIDMNSLDASRIMSEYNVDSLIVTEDYKPVGIVTGRDIIRKLATHDAKPSTVKLRDVMTRELIGISPDEDVVEAAKFMSKKRIRRLAVVDGGKLMGILADFDILSLYSGMNTILVDLIEMNRERAIAGSEGVQGICEACGQFSDDLKAIGDSLVCESCRGSI